MFGEVNQMEVSEETGDVAKEAFEKTERVEGSQGSRIGGAYVPRYRPGHSF